MKSQSRLVQFALWASVIFMLTVSGLYEVSRNPKLQLMGELVTHVNTDQKVVALTFDDGPKPGATQSLLEILKQEDILATFYLNGNPMQNNPRETKLIIDAGHEIGNHSMSHRRMVMMPYDEVAEEIESTTKIIREYGYTGNISFRPPYGKSLFVLPYYLKKNNITTVTWNVESETFIDGEDTPDKIIKRTLDQVEPGSIIIMHPMYDEGACIEALPTIIRKLKEQGYAFTTVDKLISLGKNSR